MADEHAPPLGFVSLSEIKSLPKVQKPTQILSLLTRLVDLTLMTRLSNERDGYLVVKITYTLLHDTIPTI